eukprot:scaffold29980_cov26-Tisochrysis_lutea.AAC.2
MQSACDIIRTQRHTLATPLRTIRLSERRILVDDARMVPMAMATSSNSNDGIARLNSRDTLGRPLRLRPRTAPLNDGRSDHKCALSLRSVGTNSSA